MWESPAPNSESTEGMLPSADFPREGSKDLRKTPADSKLAITYPCKFGHQPSPRHKPSPAAEHTLGQDLVSHQDLKRCKVTKCHTKTSLISNPFQMSQRPSVQIPQDPQVNLAVLLPMGTRETTITHGKPGDKIAPSHPLNYKNQLPGGHRELGVFRQE